MSTKQFCFMQNYLKTSSFFYNLFFLPCGRVDRFSCATHKVEVIEKNLLLRICGAVRRSTEQKKSNSLFVQAISLQKGPSKAFLFYSSFRPTRTEPSLRGKGKKRRREFEKGPSPRALALSFCRPPAAAPGAYPKPQSPPDSRTRDTADGRRW